MANHEYSSLLKLAQQKGWSIPRTDNQPQPAWVNYWKQCIEYEKNPDAGRPVVPHRSGR